VRPEDLRTLSPRDNRRAGAVLGLAVGDALGATYEFCSPDEVPEGPLEIVGGGWLSLEPGETTDDTALARAVLIGYQSGSLDLRRVRDAMLSWEDTRPKDIGNQTMRAFAYLRRRPEALSLPDDPEAQGNGAVMRAAAHGAMAQSPAEAVRNAWAEAALTHPSETARASSALIAAVTARLIEVATPAEALEVAFSATEDETGYGGDPRAVFWPDDIEELVRSYPEDRSRWGWTVHTTRLALGCLLQAMDFRSGLEEVVRLGGDADTNGAVAGALLGARFGASAIPPEWLREVRGKEGLLRLL
jgi:ADP-ribosyl-[dinitrogen reductase] hydrolase